MANIGFSESKSQLKTIFQSAVTGLLAAFPFVFVFAFITIPQIKTKTLKSKADSLQIAVESVFNILEFNHKRFQSGELTETQAKQQALQTINALRYNQKEYFWINDLTPNMVMHPYKPEMNGKSLVDYKDPNGKKLFVEMVQVTQEKGQGFVDYIWPKHDSPSPVGKTSFVKKFAPWGWIVGSGVYTDDVELEIKQNTQTILKWLVLASILSITFSVLLAIRQLNKFYLPVQSVLKQLIEKSSHLSRTSEHLQEVSGGLSVSSATQTESIAQTAAASTETQKLVESSASNAEQAKNSALEAENLAKAGKSAVSEVTSSLNQISSSTEDLFKAINETTQSISEITELMKAIRSKTELIDEIVFQTKLLSFNASVEAARAGESGKGFSVVAEEVGQLAVKSGQSSQEIASQLVESQVKVEQIVSSAQEKIGRLAQLVNANLGTGQSAVSKCESILEKVFEKTSTSRTMSTSIAAATEEQLLGINNITQAMQSIEIVTEQTKMHVKSTTASANDLAVTAAQLDEMVSQLKKVVNDESQAA